MSCLVPGQDVSQTPSLVQGLRHEPADFWLSKVVDLPHLLRSLKQQSSQCYGSALYVAVMAFMKLYMTGRALPIGMLSIIIHLVGEVVLMSL